MATLALLGLTALFAVFGTGAPVALGLPAALLAVVTVLCTSMIYAQLRTVPRWHAWTTPALFVAFAATGGALLAGQTGAAIFLLVVLGAATGASPPPEAMPGPRRGSGGSGRSGSSKSRTPAATT